LYAAQGRLILQLELADWLDFDGVLDFRQHTSTDEDLSRFGFVAEVGGAFSKNCKEQVAAFLIRS
jgi:hypothetical protein